MNLTVIKQLRRQKKVSLKKLSDSTGISANTLSAIENNKTDPGVNKVEAILKALDCGLTISISV